MARQITTLRLRQNRRNFPNNVFKYIFFKGSVWISITISLKFVPKVRINNTYGQNILIETSKIPFEKCLTYILKDVYFYVNGGVNKN